MGVPSLGWKDSLEKDMATDSSILAWRNPWTQEPGGPQSIGSRRVRCDRSDLACMHHLYFLFCKLRSCLNYFSVLLWSPYGSKELYFWKEIDVAYDIICKPFLQFIVVFWFSLYVSWPDDSSNFHAIEFAFFSGLYCPWWGWGSTTHGPMGFPRCL